jgi:Kef-type K+ transport system membrane component KefB/mannitol/fructose-specific phosphotransferase system IIA component (Ntr-type)
MDSGFINNAVAVFALQLGIIFFAVRLFGRLAKKIGVPQLMGELVAGIIIGPFALGGLPVPGFPQGIFDPGMGLFGVSGELYAFASIASVVLLFASGLETNISLFLKYSAFGILVGLGGAVVSFFVGTYVGVFLLHTTFMDPRCLFLGILSTLSSMGITARILTDHKKLDSPEGVTILAAAVFDDMLGMVAMAVVLGIAAVSAALGSFGDGFNVAEALAIGGKAFGIWLGVTALGLLLSKKIAAFLKLFKSPADFSILALGIALILAGIFEKQGLALKIGAYIAGISLSRTDIAHVIQERIRGIYDFFVPVFFVVMGMMVNFRFLFMPQVFIFGIIYTATILIAKAVGSGGPALLLGFNAKGALRIGMGMVPRGELVLILSGVGLAAGILSESLYAAVIIMTLITTLAAPSLAGWAFKLPGRGTRKPARDDNLVSLTWEFSSKEVADLVVDTLLKDLSNEGFYIQVMSIDEGLSQARKDDISIFIKEEDKTVTIDTFEKEALFVKTAVYEVIVELHESIHKLQESFDTQAMKKEILKTQDEDGHKELLSYITSECTSVNLKGNTKEEIIAELVDILASGGRLLDRDMVLKDVWEREQSMNTGMEYGIALPHARTEGADELLVAMGIKKEGIDFGSIDGQKSRLFILIVSPKRAQVPYIEFLAAIGAALHDDTAREAVINAPSPEVAVTLLHTGERRKRE